MYFMQYSLCYQGADLAVQCQGPVINMIFSGSTTSLTPYPLWTKKAGYFHKIDMIPQAFWSPATQSPHHLQKCTPQTQKWRNEHSDKGKFAPYIHTSLFLWYLKYLSSVKMLSFQEYSQ